ncbi:HD-GYP domain-containing protein [Cohnella faecalis]|uniref:HD-GYP domain-containing protein n=1 Tax=Cohnella faecalis TaxID=2315694 RepID=A0A398CL70_9BACL|nr:HD-GYP domain-containing protein [Cohnella faecalis]RIE03155.1 HD-GYP domain-containing protein [Cohnella faecalis]
MELLRDRHEETYRHCVRVSLLGEKLARSLRMSEQDIEALVRGCLLHDVGKLLVSLAILDASGPLDERQWDEMKRHPRIGADILESMGLRGEIIDLVLHHHERWDGQGYPSGLHKEEIPYGARICAVVDAFDSMMSDRPYRQGKTVSEALEELRKHAGTQFDEAIVESFSRLAEELGRMYDIFG